MAWAWHMTRCQDVLRYASALLRVMEDSIRTYAGLINYYLSRHDRTSMVQRCRAAPVSRTF